MTKRALNQSFVTDGRIALARNYADALAAKHPGYGAAECAEKAVRKIFGRWILDHTAAVRAEYLPLYFQLTNAVESRLGVHRRPRYRARPVSPALRAALPWTAAVDAGEFVGTTAIAV
jgi:hypothetical protein